LKLGAKERKVTIIGLGIIAILALLYVLIFSRPGSEGLNDTVELKKKTLLKQRETLYLEGVYESRLQMYKSRLQANRAKLLPGDNPNVAGAELLKTLTNFADRNGVVIISKSVLPEDKMENNLMKISVRLQTQCDMEQLVRYMVEIQNYDKFLTIDEFMFRTSRNRRDDGMRHNLTISGYIDSNENAVTGDQNTSL